MAILSQIKLLQDNSGTPGGDLTSFNLSASNTFWVEIQLQDSRTNAAGIVGAGLQLNWDSNSLTAESAAVTSNLPFSQLNDLNTAGVAKIGGGSLPGQGQPIGTNKFDRFATVKLIAKSNLTIATNSFTITAIETDFSTADGSQISALHNKV
jgi:hypothetical protein